MARTSRPAARTVVLVDGSNVARCSRWRRQVAAVTGSTTVADDDLRRRLVDAVAGWAVAEDRVVRLVFDGAGPWQEGSVDVAPGVTVEASGSRDGDALLERAAATLRGAGIDHWIVTEDRALQAVAGVGAQRVIGADAFVVELGQQQRATARSSSGGAGRSPKAGADDGGSSRLADTLDDSARARLERMRRGL